MTSKSSATRFIASFHTASPLAPPPGRRALLGSFALSLGPMLSLMLGLALGGSQPLMAQNGAAPAATPATTAATKKPAHPRKHKTAAQAKAEKVEAAAAPAAPATPSEPEAPHWPVNDKPTPATITWDSQGLRVVANNSSLAQILQDVATVTGATIEGFDDDRRIFGVYGPGQAHDVLSQILQGSGYNVVMVGDLGQGAPRQIVLTLQSAARDAKAAKDAEKKAAAGDDDDDDADEQPAQAAQPSPPPLRTPAQFNQDAQRHRQAGNLPPDATPHP